MRIPSTPAAAASLLAALCCTTTLAQQIELVPLTDLGAAHYLGEQGGLYPGGVNTPPASHLDAALERAQSITPRAADGQPDPNGLIGFVSVGMSNTTQEFGAFQHMSDSSNERNARIVIVNTAQGGQDAAIAADPAADYWTFFDDKIQRSGITPAQVQVCWLKQAEAIPLPTFPEHAIELRDHLESIVQILHDRFPNLQICYLSSRIYGGYGKNEPIAYESGFAAKWLIEDQIEGDAALNYGGQPGPIEAPLLLWGPYLWSSGAVPNAQGAFWLPDDFEDFGTNLHPSAAGVLKVAQHIVDFLDTDPTAQSWWPSRPDSSLVVRVPTDDASVDAGAPFANFGADPRLEVGDGLLHDATTYLRFDVTTVDRPIISARLSLRVVDDANGGSVEVFIVPEAAWSEDQLTFVNAPSFDPVAIGEAAAAYSRDSSVGIPVEDAVISDDDGIVSFALHPVDNNDAAFLSKEAGVSPLLILSLLDVPCPADSSGDGEVGVADLLVLIGQWGPCDGSCTADANGDGVVDTIDLIELLQSWGPCLAGP